MNVLDLFCGAGGFSHGFQQAGFKIKYGIDYDKRVKKTYEHNHPNAEFILSDIKELNPNDFKNVDIIIGSPPCPEFSQAKRNPNPQKGMLLVNEFLKWINIIKPKFWIGENVPNLIKYLPQNNFRKKIIDCVNYGVPQFRKRVFFGNYILPEPTHARVPTVTLVGKKLKKWVTVQEAIGDLIEHINKIFLTDQFGYDTKPHTPIYDATKRPSRTLTVIPPRQIMNLEMTDSSQESMQRKLNCKFGMQTRYNNFSLDKPSITITDMHGDAPIVEIKTKDSFDKTWLKKHPVHKVDRPAYTLRAREMRGCNSNCFLEMDKIYRRLTIRECARLQSFPDDFIFFGSKSACYRMIGNAVPPLMSWHLAKAIKEVI